MKYLIAILSLIIFFIYGQVFKKEFPLVLNLAIITLIFILSFLSEYTTINKKIDADIKFRSQKKTISIHPLILPICFTLLFFYDENYKDILLLVLFIWSIIFSGLLMSYIYKRKKPFTIFINGNELILNKLLTQKRNLTELTEIQYDRISKELIFDFKSKIKISIKSTEYKPDDIQKLLEIMIDKSEYHVFIPTNYEPLKKSW